MDRRSFLKKTGLGVAGLALNQNISCTRKPKPNIVLIYMDDQGYADWGCYDADGYETPNIDKIASDGMQFSNAYASDPVCSPTRAGIMTGKHPARLHLTDYIPGSPYPHAR